MIFVLKRSADLGFKGWMDTIGKLASKGLKLHKYRITTKSNTTYVSNKRGCRYLANGNRVEVGGSGVGIN